MSESERDLSISKGETFMASSHFAFTQLMLSEKSAMRIVRANKKRYGDTLKLCLLN